MAVRAVIGGAAVQEFPLSFNDIIAHVPGQRGRGDAKKGMYEHKNGNILVVYTVNPQFVEIEARRNGKRTNKTGFTRTGMAIIEKASGKMRLVTADRDPDGKKEWREFKGDITLSGNPHRVDKPQAAAPAAQEEYEDDDE